MSNNPVIRIGDTWDFKGTITESDDADPPVQQPYNCSAATEIKAVIKRKDSSTAYCDPVTLSAGADGADWSTGVLTHKFLPSITSQIGNYISRNETAEIEIQITIGGDIYTWETEVDIRLGAIN